MNDRLGSASVCSLLFLLINAPTTSFAQGAWCARMIGGGENCGFATMGQCQAALSGNGGVCSPSPRAAARNAPPQSDEVFRRAKAEQARAAAQRQFEQEQRRRAAAPMAPKTPPAVAIQSAPVSAPVNNAAPLIELDTNATPTLSPDGVRRIQAALKRKGFDPGPANGILHSQMQVAVRSFQTTYGINARGILDNQTLLALGEADLTR
jgi:hypothetical protein